MTPIPFHHSILHTPYFIPIHMQQIKPNSMDSSKLSKERPFSQLQLDSPRLPSARRSISSSIETNITTTNAPNLICDTSSGNKLSTMVPFSWESSPGVPKDLGQIRASLTSDMEPDQPPPKPPPCKWHLNNIKNAKNGYDRYECDVSEGSSEYGDASDALFDRVSVSEQLGIAGRLSSFRGLGLETKNPSQSFIMERFLPAANAIANSSVTRKPKQRAHRNEQSNDKIPIPPPIENRTAVQMVPFDQNVDFHKEMSSRACGLMLFFPWKMKPIVCGFKNPAFINQIPHENTDSLNPRNNNSRQVHNIALFDKRPSYRERLLQGFGLPFLDTSRLPSKKTLMKLMQKDVIGRNKRNVENKDGRNMGYFEQSSSLPELRPPAHSWLSHTLGSTNH